MRSDEKLEFWKLMIGIFAAGDVPSKDESLVHRIRIVTDFRDKVLEVTCPHERVYLLS